MVKLTCIIIQSRWFYEILCLIIWKYMCNTGVTVSLTGIEQHFSVMKPKECQLGKNVKHWLLDAGFAHLNKKQKENSNKK